MGKADSNQFLRLSNQLAIAAEYIDREETLSPVLIPTMPKNRDEQLKLAHKLVDVVDRANREICLTLLGYILEKLESFYAQVQIFARKNEDEKFQQRV